jgi:N-acetylneuraminate synthase
MSTVTIGNKKLGEGYPCYVIAEIGINHNGDIDLAKRLISVAAAAGCDAVKFQKRTVDIVYTAAELATPRPNPFGETNGDLKRGLEFGEEDYEEIAKFCKSLKIPWLVSPWDEPSVDFMENFDTPVYKIASASLTDDALLKYVRKTGKPIIASTGMSTYAEIDHAVEVLGKENLILMHTTSTYPAKYEQLNLKAIPSMIERYGIPVGYSGHETGIPTTVAAAILGACCVERHIRLVEQSMGDGVKRVYDEEIPVMKKLRRVGAAA